MTPNSAAVPNPRIVEIWYRAYSKVKMRNRIKKLLSTPQFYYDETLNRFVSRNEVKPDETEVKVPGARYVFSPQGGFYTVWLAYVSFMLLYLAIGDPFISSFLDMDGNLDLKRLDIVIDFTFIIDFLVTLNLGYYDEDGNLEISRKKIFKNYLKGWMVIDLSSSIPFGLIGVLMGTSSGTDNLIRMVRLRNIPKLFRLAKLVKMLTNFSMFEDLDYILSKYNKQIRFIKVMLIVFGCIHIAACLFYLAAKVDEFGPETWVYRHNVQNFSIDEKYTTSLYWAITTLGTIGYGDLVPRTVNEKLLAMVWMIIGVYVVSYSVGSLTSFYADVNLKDTLKHDRIIMAEDFSKKVGIPKHTLHRLKRTIKMADIQPTRIEQDKLFQGIGPELKVKIAENIYEHGISHITFLEGKEDSVRSDIALRLEQVSGITGDTVWVQNEASECIYFIIEGRVKLSYCGTVFNTPQQGHYFGDIEIVNGTERLFTVVSLDNYRFLKMNMQLIERIQEIYPLVWKEIKEKSKIRLKNLLQNLAQMKLIIKLNSEAGVKNLNLTECKAELNEIFEKLYLDCQNADKKNFKVKMKRRLESTATSISNISDLVDVIFK
jgi:CRP-like cAMP-binding protein